MVLLILFFFFKQKTAYEMRISDWSSDVCSSDLVTARPDGSSDMVPRVPHLNRRVLLAQRPDGLVREDDFTFDSQPIAEPGDGEVLVRTDWLGIDATVRTWLSQAEGYIEPVAIGDDVRGRAVEIGRAPVGTPGTNTQLA